MQSNTAEHPRRRRAAHSLQRVIHDTHQQIKDHAPRRATAHETKTTQGAVAVPAPPRITKTRPERVERLETLHRMGRRGLDRTRAGGGDARGHHAEEARLRVRRSPHFTTQTSSKNLVERAALLRPALDPRATVVAPE